MDEAAKKAAPPGPSQPADPNAPAPAPVDSTPQEEPEDPGPQNLKDLIKESFIDSKTWNRMLQITLLVAGIYGLLISVKGQTFLPLPGLLGALALVLTAVLDALYIKRFKEKHENVEVIARFVLAGMLTLMAIVFAIEFARRFDVSYNKVMMLASAVAIALVFAINFFLYIAKNKEKIVADLYMFAAVALGFCALFTFYVYYVAVSIVLAALSMMALIASITNDPLKDDERFGTRVSVLVLVSLMFLAILGYASTIFFIENTAKVISGPVTDDYRIKPTNLGWSGDSWSFDYSLYDTKKKEGKVGIINALSLGVTELPPKNQEDLKLPKFTDAAVWNKNGSCLVLTAGDEEKGPRNIWAVALNLSLVEQEKNKAAKEKEEKEKAEKEAREKEGLVGELKEEIMLDKERLSKEPEKTEVKLRTKEDDKYNRPVGKPKVLLADMNLIVDKMCMPITHRTAWSPDGRKFCFAAKDENSEDYNIWSADVKSQEITKLTKGKNKVMPLWSPSGEKILWCSKTDSYTYLKVSDFNGKNARELSIDRKKDRALFPLWNAEESKVIYIKNNKFIVMNANATNQQELSRETFPKSPYWLTEAKKKVRLEFTESGTIWRVWTMDPDGKKVKNIFTEVCEELAQPKWSYDGKQVALAAFYKDKTSSVFRLNKDGSMRAPLYTTDAHVTELEWANSSERLAFLAKREAGEKHEENVEELWVMENDGTDPRITYETEGKLNNISWNDLGNRIAFDETVNRIYFLPAVTAVKVSEVKGDEVTTSLLPYEFYGQYPTWSQDGQVLAYVSWNKNWTPGIGIGIGYGLGYRVWAAQLE
jgi:Tol biopolymer transport system component